MLEKQVERKLVDGVRKLGGVAVKFVSPASNGWPDRLLLLPGGRMWFIELKSDTGRLSVLQAARIRVLQQLGFDARVLKGAEQVKQFLQDIDNRIRPEDF